jgi:hypothetical protein
MLDEESLFVCYIINASNAPSSHPYIIYESPHTHTITTPILS